MFYSDFVSGAKLTCGHIFCFICEEKLEVEKLWDNKYLMLISVPHVFRSVPVCKVCHQISGQSDLRQERTPEGNMSFRKCHTLVCYTLHLCHKHSKSISIVFKILKIRISSLQLENTNFIKITSENNIDIYIWTLMVYMNLYTTLHLLFLDFSICPNQPFRWKFYLFPTFIFKPSVTRIT